MEIHDDEILAGFCFAIKKGACAPF